MLRIARRREAYVAFRAPLQPPNDRKDALLIGVTNFASLVTHGNPGSTPATFGAPLQWDLGGLALREIRRNADGEFLAIAGTSTDANSQFGLYEWDGNPAHPPVLTETALSPLAEGAWEDIVSVPDPIANGSTVELLEDNGESVWYGDGLTSKTGMPSGLQKDLGRLFTISLPRVIAGAVKGKLIVKSGETVRLEPTAVTNNVEVQPGGSLKVNGASTKAIKSSGATAIRICGATLTGSLKISGTTGPTVVGDEAGCSPSKVSLAVVLSGDTGGQKVIGNTVGGKLSVTAGAGARRSRTTRSPRRSWSAATRAKCSTRPTRSAGA